MRRLQRDGRYGSPRAPQWQPPAHAKTETEIELLSEDKVNRLERTLLVDLFRTQWRLVSFDNFIVGYAPFPDASVIIPPYGANRVLTQLYNYVVDPKRRMGAIPYCEFLPQKGKPGIDYFLMDRPEDVNALLWYVATSAALISTEFAAYLSDPGRDPRAVFAHLALWYVEASTDGGEVAVMWPSKYWQSVNSDSVILRQVLRDPEGILHGRTSDAEDAQRRLSQFTRAWMQDCTRGIVPGFKLAIRAAAERMAE